WAAGAAAGFLSVPHCVGMCGPLWAFSRGSTASLPLVRYQLGRTLSYVALGALSGGLAAGLAQSLLGGWAGADLAWLFAAMLVLAALRLWRSPETSTKETQAPLLRLTKPSRGVAWLAETTAWLRRHLPRGPLTLGFLSACLPCGALHLAVALAATSGGTAH